MEKVKEIIKILVEKETDILIEQGKTPEEIEKKLTPERIRELYNEAAESFKLKMIKILQDKEQRQNLVEHFYYKLRNK